jgi:hypothetical protein
LFENPLYLSGKRYSDIMKTMWFTFLYSSVIPFGTICSCIGLVFYYWADKYNLIKKFTAKENISLDLTVSMIDLLDFIVIWHAVIKLTLFLFKYSNKLFFNKPSF